MNERTARQKFWQILSAVEYCHNQNIVHRDLKVSTLYYVYKINEFSINLKIWPNNTINCYS